VAYELLVQRAMRVLAGDTEELRSDLEGRMRAASERQEYELAAGFRDRLAALGRTVEAQGVLSAASTERDVLALARAGERVLVHRLSIRRGKLERSQGFALRSELSDEECLHEVLTRLYGGDDAERPRELVLPFLPAEHELLGSLFGDTEWVVPRGGERARQLELARENAALELGRAVARAEALDEAEEGLARLCALERGEAQPLMIDCFDVSNLQGTHVVASRVRFRGGHPDRSGFRRYRVKSVRGQDDFQAMHEVVGRSLRRGLDEGELPDLVVIDGGAAQLASALSAAEDAGAFEVRIVALAKARPGRRRGGREQAPSEERLFLAPDAAPVVLAPHSAIRLLLERVRDEAHRFALAYHRKERGKLRSRLDAIRGLGPARKKALLARFGSVRGVEAASVEELASVPGISSKLARQVAEALRRPEGASESP
jgi:excinuclease ABC subunit C